MHSVASHMWLLKLSIVFSRFTHIGACISSLFHSVAEKYPTVWICHIWFIYSTTDVYLSLFGYNHAGGCEVIFFLILEIISFLCSETLLSSCFLWLFLPNFSGIIVIVCSLKTCIPQSAVLAPLLSPFRQCLPSLLPWLPLSSMCPRFLGVSQGPLLCL